MATRSSKQVYDKSQHYDSMSTSQLENSVEFWKRAVSRNPELDFCRNELTIVKAKLAERIGRK